MWQLETALWCQQTKILLFVSGAAKQMIHNGKFFITPSSSNRTGSVATTQMFQTGRLLPSENQVFLLLKSLLFCLAFAND